MDDTLDNEVASSAINKLPIEIVTALKRKSSRDPNSRFPRKLHLLLSFLNSNPSLVDDFGLEWVTNDEFRMNKKIVSQVMGIKLNTLNVNLRDLEFKQLQHDKNGWTKWSKTGFTKHSVFPDVANEGSIVKPSTMNDENAMKKRKNPIKQMPDYHSREMMKLGAVNPNLNDQFAIIVEEIWISLFRCNKAEKIPQRIFIDKAANEFKQQEQPLENAIEVIRAIIAPIETTHLLYSDLYKFLAMFGPKSTIMLKIAQLLTCSNNTGSWLHFTPDPPTDIGSEFTGCFNIYEPNCLVLKYRDGSERHIWNNPLIDAMGTYLTDDNGRTYNSWDSFFLNRSDIGGSLD